MATRWQGPWTRGLFGEKLKVLSLISAFGKIVSVWVPFHSEIYIFLQLGLLLCSYELVCLQRLIDTSRVFMIGGCVALLVTVVDYALVLFIAVKGCCSDARPLNKAPVNASVKSTIEATLRTMPQFTVSHANMETRCGT